MELFTEIRQLAQTHQNDSPFYRMMLELVDESQKLESHRNRLNHALQTLINLNEGGKGITGEEWEIASYALVENQSERNPVVQNSLMAL